MKNKKIIKFFLDANYLFVTFLILLELYQYYIALDSGLIGGDFQTNYGNVSSLNYGLLISILSWIVVIFLSKLTTTKKEPRFIPKIGFPILILFAFNFFLTYYLDIGNVINKGASPLSFLTTLIPINYFIFIVFMSFKSRANSILSIILFLGTDLFRFMIGGFFKVFYLSLSFFYQKKKYLILALPIIFILSNFIINYKIMTRTGLNVDLKTSDIIEIVSSRISSFNSNAYIVDNHSSLDYLCNNFNYDKFYTAAMLSVIPKKIFGLEYVKTYNNCLIENRVKREVFDSSVNAPFLSIIFLLKAHALKLAGFLLLIITLFVFIIKFSNYLFGYYAIPFNFWVLFEFFWTGNILTLTIPAYFILIIFLYFKLFVKTKS